MPLSRLLLLIWILGLLGVAAELVLLEHYEDVKQFIPFVVIAGCVLVGAWLAIRPGQRAAERAFQLTIALLAISGVLGVVFHYWGNLEFERERDASLSGLRLVWEVLTGATPALAPGTMILFAFIGYAVIEARRQPRRSSEAESRGRGHEPRPS
ncbi:MAG TPA: hypothetical protein VEB19_00005 [Gemmatimonadaceae bacterium]|nr:hypothetical protein [Gemmatimonadaceae bacterium]